MHIKFKYLTLVLLLIATACKKKDVEGVKVSTENVDSVTTTTAVAQGSILDLGAGISDHGFCWATTHQPTLEDESLSKDSAMQTGPFAGTLAGLQPATLYYVRAYAFGNQGLFYGNEVSFTTSAAIGPCSGETTITFDGYSYNLVEIGSQCWFAVNLRTSKYNDSTAISNLADNTEWANDTLGAWCYYENDSIRGTTYGKLYNWYAVKTGKLCPNGWHIPTDEDWKKLEISLGISQSKADSTGPRGVLEKVGDKMKATTGWQTNTGTDSSGLSVLPGGFRSYDNYFATVGQYASFWSSTEYTSSNAWSRNLGYNNSGVGRYSYTKRDGYSCRCLRD